MIFIAESAIEVECMYVCMCLNRSRIQWRRFPSIDEDGQADCRDFGGQGRRVSPIAASIVFAVVVFMPYFIFLKY